MIQSTHMKFVATESLMKYSNMHSYIHTQRVCVKLRFIPTMLFCPIATFDYQFR